MYQSAKRQQILLGLTRKELLNVGSDQGPGGYSKNKTKQTPAQEQKRQHPSVSSGSGLRTHSIFARVHSHMFELGEQTPALTCSPSVDSSCYLRP